MHEDLGNLPPHRTSLTPAHTRGSATLVDVLADTECPSLTARRARRAEKTGVPHDPIVWARAKGINVVDVDGNVYVDWTAGFGVAVAGHSHPTIVASVQQQSSRLLHALGDVYPADVKVRLLERIAGLAPFANARVILGQSGSDAVEAALKTSTLFTKRSGVLAFTGGYHGLAYGPLSTCGYSEAFRAPFRDQLNARVAFAPYPRKGRDAADAALKRVAETWDASPFDIGTVLVEPVQARGGVVVPPDGFLAGLSTLAHERGACLVADEVYTGLARTGARFQSVAAGADADLLCLGKALGGGMPVSACVGKLDVMRAWGDPSGEALHTGTFFGHPVVCAAALASLNVIDEEHLLEKASEHGALLLDTLRIALREIAFVREVRGVGMLIGVELDSGERVLRVVRMMLERGHILLPAGAGAEVLSITPPINVHEERVRELVATLTECLRSS